jgi:hypothetical protein
MITELNCKYMNVTVVYRHIFKTMWTMPQKAKNSEKSDL